MRRHEFQLKLTVKSPVLCAGLSPSGYGYDAFFIRDESGTPIIPADHIKGLIRAWSQSGLNFGTKPADGDETPHRGDIITSDLVLKDWDQHSDGMSMIEISDETGVTETGSLRTVELVAPLGKPLLFEGTIIVWADQSVDAQSEIKETLNCIPAVGANRTIGFGEITNVELDPAGVCQSFSFKKLESSGSLSLRVTSDRPLMVGTQQPENNVFTSSGIIPGGTIKGALATKLKRLGKSTDGLEALQISHAFPLRLETGHDMLTNLPIPMDTVKWRDGDKTEYGKVTDCPDDMVPIFKFDWKDRDYGYVAERCGGATEIDRARLQRTRTQISDATQSAADGQLFVYQSYPAKGRSWTTHIRWNGDPPGQFLNTLLDGIDSVGKTSATLAFEEMTAPAKVYSGVPREEFAIMLLTPSLLLADGLPSRLKTAAYKRYWEDVFDDEISTISLSQCYAKERLLGGHIGRRYHSTEDQRYRSWILTEPGSVFRFEVGDKGKSAFEEKLKRLLRTGLPLPNWARNLSWRDCPWQPQNGYGSICRRPCLMEAENA